MMNVFLIKDGKVMTKEQVRQLRQEAALAGDDLMVEVCNDYLLRDCKEAYQECVRAARMQTQANLDDTSKLSTLN